MLKGKNLTKLTAKKSKSSVPHFFEFGSNTGVSQAVVERHSVKHVFLRISKIHRKTHMCHSFFFKKETAESLFCKKETLANVFSCLWSLWLLVR